MGVPQFSTQTPSVPSVVKELAPLLGGPICLNVYRRSESGKVRMRCCDNAQYPRLILPLLRTRAQKLIERWWLHYDTSCVSASTSSVSFYKNLIILLRATMTLMRTLPAFKVRSCACVRSKRDPCMLTRRTPPAREARAHRQAARLWRATQH